MRNLWGGLFTNASPYAIPPGAAVEQTNLVTYVPGQLTTRGGMRPVAFDTESPIPEIRDLQPYVFSNAVQVLVLTPSGSIESLPSPSLGSYRSLPSPAEPPVEPGEGEVVSNYCGTFYAYGEEPPQ